MTHAITPDDDNLDERGSEGLGDDEERQPVDGDLDASLEGYEERLRFAVQLMTEGVAGTEIQRQVIEKHHLKARAARDLVAMARQVVARAIQARAPNRYEDLAVAVWQIKEAATKSGNLNTAIAAIREYREVLAACNGEIEARDAVAALLQLLRNRLDELDPDLLDELRRALNPKALAGRKGRPHRRVANKLVDELASTEEW